MAKLPKADSNAKSEETASDDGRIDYRVTNEAPARVAGRRVKHGETLRLTEDEARAELIALHIEPIAKTAPEAASSDA